MKNSLTFEEARSLLLEKAECTGTETLPLEACGGRILAKDAAAAFSVPPFDRSPYDGYAFRASDSAGASRERPVTLHVLEEVAAGSVPRFPVRPGTAVRIMTGAPIPEGADAVVMFEKTAFTEESVTLFEAAKPGDNIVLTGEDVRAGDVLVRAGSPIDAGTLGTLASQGFASLEVFRKPRVGIISTGTELLEPGQSPQPGRIYNSNRYTFTALLGEACCEAVYLGAAGDRVETIAALLREGLAGCDAILLTGGVSVGDYDLTPAAMEACGAEIFFRGVDMKPGMACCYGEAKGKLICALSGNPAAAMTNYYAVALPALKRLAGCRSCLPQELTVTLLEGFGKKSPVTRLLRGTLKLSGGEVQMALSQEQGNAVLSSAMGCDAMAVIPAGSGLLAPGTKLKGFMLR
ncbi:MAG: molybdopterin molybdotransferase MoeA [Oscillospiraceae bacterium]|nr:molybdopterin molybdotransferase MoeA [Oscillospiraceae bacterium]